eukprot:SAG31_NODE_7570_length_1651_cov_1.224227_1_plen_158_part_10
MSSMEGEFVFTDGTVIGSTIDREWHPVGNAFHNWADGEPSDGGSGEDCTYLKGSSSSTHCELGQGTGCWNDKPCLQTKGFICGPRSARVNVPRECSDKPALRYDLNGDTRDAAGSNHADVHFQPPLNDGDYTNSRDGTPSGALEFDGDDYLELASPFP